MAVADITLRIGDSEHVKANLFGGYERGRDPWAIGGFQPTPVSGGLMLGPAADPPPAAPIEPLSVTLKRKEEEAAAGRAQRFYVLYGLGYYLRILLRDAGMPVAVATDAPDPDATLVVSKIRVPIEMLEKGGFITAAAKVFLAEFQKHNPDNALVTFFKPGLPNGVEQASFIEDDGLAMRAILAYDIGTDQFLVQIDATYIVNEET